MFHVASLRSASCKTVKDALHTRQMRWSKLYVPTLREEPSEGDPSSKLLVRAGYARYGAGGLGYLHFGQRSLAKIAAAVRRELETLGAQEVALGDAMVAAARGLRSYKQIQQLWYQQREFVIEMLGFGIEDREIRAAIERALAARGISAIVGDPEGDFAHEEFPTPDVKTIADIAAFTGMPESSQIKSVVMMCAGKLLLILVRGDHSLSEAKLRILVEGDIRAATADEIRECFGADPGSLGPVGVRGVRILADEALRGRRNMIGGANKTDYHLRYITPGRDFEPEYADLRVAVEGVGQEGTPIVVGEILVGSVAQTEPEMAFGEIAIDQLFRAAVQRDELGLVLPPAIAPFSLVFTPVNVRDDAQGTTAERLYGSAKAAGCDALLDDRDERPGVKFKDAELVGIPWRVTVGKKLAEGIVEVFERSAKQSFDVPVSNAIEFVRGRWDVIA